MINNNEFFCELPELYFETFTAKKFQIETLTAKSFKTTRSAQDIGGAILYWLSNN